MKLVVLGLNHRTAPVSVREAFALQPDEATELLAALSDHPKIAEAFVLSTCNRVEIYAVPHVSDERAIRRILVTALCAGRGLDASVLERQGYFKASVAAVTHLFRVTASLDSMIVGEPQILGQVKDAVAYAQDRGALGPQLLRITQEAFRSAKVVRTETEIARQRVSVGSVAVDLANRIFERLEDCRVLLIGTGEMGQATARALASAGVARVYVANRSYDRAVALSEEHGWRPRSFQELEDVLAEVDVVLTSTGATRPVIGVAMLKRVIRLRKYRPLFIVDIAVPRDVEEAVAGLDTIYLYNVDDLRMIAEDNLAARSREAQAAEALIATAIDSVSRWDRSLAVQPTIAAIRRRYDEVAQAELSRTIGRRLKHLGPEEQEALARMMTATVSKLLHPTMVALKAAEFREEVREWACELHGVDPTTLVAPLGELQDGVSEAESAAPDSREGASAHPRSAADDASDTDEREAS